MAAILWTAAAFVMLAALAGCGETVESDPPPRVAQTPRQIVGSPLTADRLERAVALLTNLPEDKRPAFSPAMDDFSGAMLSSAKLIEAHRLRYEAALDPGQHAAVWQRDRTVAVALREQGLTAIELAHVLTQASCAHQSAQLLDLPELRADTQLNLTRLAAAWDAGGQPELDRLALEQAIGELVALDEYLALLEAVPPQNQTLAQTHWDDLQQFLPATQLRDRLEKIVEYDLRPIQQASGSQPAHR